MAALEIEVDQDSINNALSLFRFLGGNSNLAVSVAINRTLAKTKTRAASTDPWGIRSRANLLSGFVKERLEPEKATRNKLSAKLKAQSKGLLITKYDYKPRTSLLGKIVTPDSPIRVKVKPGAGTIKPVSGDPGEVYGNPFYMRLKFSDAIGIGMWRRTPTAKNSRIKIFHSSSVSQIFTTVREDLRPKVSEDMELEMIRAMRDLLARKYPAE